MRRCEKGPAAPEVSGKRRRKSCRRIAAQVESGSGDPNAGEHRARNTELHPQGPETATERHAQHPEPQVRSFLAERGKENGGEISRVKNSTFFPLQDRCPFQIPGGTIEEEIPGRERGGDGAEGEQGPGPGVLHVRAVLGAILSP